MAGAAAIVGVAMEAPVPAVVVKFSEEIDLNLATATSITEKVTEPSAPISSTRLGKVTKKTSA